MEGLAEKDKFTNLREEEIERQLKQLNKPAVMSFHLPNGDIIDCVRITDQPAFDHPLLKDHQIQMRPSNFFPTSAPKEAQSSRQSYTTTEESTFWPFKNCKKCPEFTVPIIRTTREALIRRANCPKKTAPPFLGINP